MATQYLVFAALSDAQVRSAAQAQANGCQAPTLYWWGVIAGPGGQAALMICDSGDYGPAGLTAGEVSALQTAAQMTAAGWTVPQ